MAKWYYAKMHVATQNFVARPGEVMEGDFSEEDIARWLRIGAVAECEAPVGVPYDAPDEPKTAAAFTEKVTEEAAEEAEPETEDVEPEPVAVDAMDGITPAPGKKTPPKTARKAQGGRSR